MKRNETISREAHIKGVAASMLNILIAHRNGENAKIGKLEISIAEEPTDQLFKDRCRREIGRIKERIEDTQQLIDHINKFELNGQPIKYKRPCKSLLRARGFCLLLMQQAGQLPHELEKTELLAVVKKHFPEQSPHKMYLLLKTNERMTLKDADKFPSDYEYGLTLFNLKTGK